MLPGNVPKAREHEMTAPAVRPIIVVGMNRSGTKWLSNIIARHRDVIAVQSPRTNGIVETNMFGPLPDKFDLSSPDEYIGLVELWAATHFFRCTGVDKELFYGLRPRPTSGLQLFDVLMSAYAVRHHKAYWLQKTSPLNAEKVAAHFKQARIVVIRRELMDTVRSTLGLQAWSGKRNLFRAAWNCAYQRKLLNRLCRRYPAVEMDYDRLRADPAGEEARLLDELGLDRDTQSREDAFTPNTSFASRKHRQEIMSRRARLYARVLTWIVLLTPLPVLSTAIALRGWFRPRPVVVPLVSDTFGELGDRLADNFGGAERPRHVEGREAAPPIAHSRDSVSRP